jgi:diacylglycerol kinase (ATP)
MAIGKRTLLLVNAKARRGAESIAPIVETFEAGALDVTMEPFEALPEIARDIVRLRDMADRVVVCGGDGTVSSSAMAVMESGLPLEDRRPGSSGCAQGRSQCPWG